MQSETSEFRSPRGLASPSSNSDIMSASGRSLAGGLPAVTPRPLYIAESAAESLTSAELDRPTAVTEASLDLLNSFLDQILYNLLSISKSTSILAIRIAIPKLLRPRLGQAALNAGDEEVREILEAHEYEQTQPASTKIRPSDFDLELIWKLARLRCMVYSRFGDLEEEDEDEVLEREGLTEHAQNPKAASSPIEALFLAAVLGFLAEQALCAAAQNAEKRHNHHVTNRVTESGSNPDVDDEVLQLEPTDLMQLGREGPLSRLWRSWRRDSRSTDPVPSRPGSRGNALSTAAGESFHTKQASMTSPVGPIAEEHMPEQLTPAQIPLPVRDNDVDEIEVPGLAPPLEGEIEEGLQVPERSSRRPSSMLIFTANDVLPMQDNRGNTDRHDFTQRPELQRHRSQSLPGTAKPPPFSPRNRSRDTMIFSPGQAPDTEGPQVGDRVQESQNADNGGTDDETDLQDNESIPRNQQSTSDTPRRPGNARTSITSGTVAALAGAVGVEAMRSSRTNKDHQALKTAGQGEKAQNSRTVAEKMLTPRDSVAPPTDAHTGSSITGPSDVDSTYIPHNSEGQVGPDRGDENEIASDPEDLALSSGDEETYRHQPQQEQQATRDSGFAVAESSHREPGSSVERAMASSPPSSPSSPKRAKREAAIYENAMSMPTHSNEESARGSAYTHAPETANEQTSPHEGPHDSFKLPIQHSVPETIMHPQRGSSRDAPPASYVATKSHHSRESGSSSSGKVFVHAWDQNGRPQSLNQQRAAFSESSQGGHSRNASASKEQTLASRRGRLRMSTDDDHPSIEEAKKKSLEILIKSDETLHYTLTPESARAAEVFPAEVKPKTKTQDLADFLRTTAPPGHAVVRPATAGGPMNGVRLNPTSPTAKPFVAPNQATAIPRPQTPKAQPHSSPGGPRDARPERNTTRDLADYMRSTGPALETQLAQALGTMPDTEDVALQQHGGLRSDGVPVAPVGNKSLDSSRPATSERSVNRLKFQARDARPTRNTETSELIDFIREGPPRTAGDHRIDRKVAPFRTTMDSDDLNALALPPEVNGRGSVGSAPESAVTSKSLQESTNSRTALLETTNRANVRPVRGVARSAVAEENGMPTRHRRRPRDPYDIDDSDDELERMIATPKPQRDEESLIDFLRNTAPPPGMSPQPILSAVPQAQSQPGMNRSASSTRLRNVLTRSTSFTSRSSVGSKATNGAREGAREESPHLTQVGSKRDKYRPTQPTHAAHVDRNRQQQRARVEAREPTNNTSGTADLAHYLKNTGPPEAPKQPQPLPTKDQAGFLKFFSRRASVKR